MKTRTLYQINVKAPKLENGLQIDRLNIVEKLYETEHSQDVGSLFIKGSNICEGPFETFKEISEFIKEWGEIPNIGGTLDPVFGLPTDIVIIAEN